MKRLFSVFIAIIIYCSCMTACTPKERVDSSLSNSSNSSSITDEQNSSTSEDLKDSSSLEDSSSEDLSDSSSTQEEYFVFFITENVELAVGEFITLEWEIVGDYGGGVRFRAQNDCVSISYDYKLTALKEGKCEVEIVLGEKSDKITVTIVEGEDLESYYATVSESEFYANYTPAKNSADALLRSKYYLMSGSIAEQDQEPTIADNRPIEGDLYLKNSNARYSSDKSTYYVVDKNGIVVKEIYKGGAYVTLEEVAAYVFAFNDVPVNYTESKKTKPTQSEWGVYLRVNHSSFSGDTSRYPYEPVLPNISGCGGSYRYYELDIGTTGTTAGNYDVAVYNNGSYITRGAARIVYSRYDGSVDITNPSEKYLFYTYNHYNDFQEYLNYYNGWGEIFGNITGGGALSSKYDYNPTSYVEVALYNFEYFGNYGENTPVNIFANYLPNYNANLYC